MARLRRRKNDGGEGGAEASSEEFGNGAVSSKLSQRELDPNGRPTKLTDRVPAAIEQSTMKKEYAFVGLVQKARIEVRNKDVFTRWRRRGKRNKQDVWLARSKLEEGHASFYLNPSASRYERLRAPAPSHELDLQKMGVKQVDRDFRFVGPVQQWNV
ncbi:hypothetical protein BP5796_03305 [Coleophoma crateriformis]|uniref:Uncharacterized protein n=1 Tax=Coleophoma crateriformis TaxID=565419 RepID=A0A3D8SN61_9HELO|nr:hypothetical protein BP5796_03305 [Coleophoma crateriformis]